MKITIMETTYGYTVIKERDGAEYEFSVAVPTYDMAMELVIKLAQSQALLGE